MNHNEFTAKIHLNSHIIEKVFVYLLILLCLGIAGKAAIGFFQAYSIAGTMRESMEFLEAQNDKAKEYIEAYASKVSKLNEKGAFCPEKKEPPPPQIIGILGQSVLISDKWCKVNEEHAGVKVLKIEPTAVTILWQGKEMTLAPLLASVSNASDVKPGNKIGQKTEAIADNSQQANITTAVQSAEEDPLAWLGMEISDSLRAFLLKLFEIMPADQLENAKQEWANMSEDEKKQRLDEMQQMVDSGQADTVLEQMKQSGN